MTHSGTLHHLRHPRPALCCALLAGLAFLVPDPARAQAPEPQEKADPPARSAERRPPQRPRPAARKTPTVLVAAGEFLMGREPGVKVKPAETPRRTVTLEAFRIDRLEVTNREYGIFLRSVQQVHPATCHPTEAPGKDHTPGAKWWKHPEWNAPEKPVVGVDWFDAYAYCAWAGTRLPTEAEWEKAARGTDGRRYPWGDEFPADRLVGNFADAAALRAEPEWNVLREYDDGFARTAPVGSFPVGASPYGAEDMLGNIWEWVADWHSDAGYAGLPEKDPTGPAEGRYRVLRGASWDATPQFLRVTTRRPHIPGYRGSSAGFRCARDVP